MLHLRRVSRLPIASALRVRAFSHRPDMTGPLYDPPRPRAIATAAHKPDTGGPLFDADQAGAELHHPKQGGDAKAKKSDKGDKGQKEQGKKKKMSGGSSFADLKMLRNEGKD